MEAYVVLVFDEEEKTVSIVMGSATGTWVSEPLRTDGDFLEALAILEEEGVLTVDSSIRLMELAGELDLPQGDAQEDLKEGTISFCRTRQRPQYQRDALSSGFRVPQAQLIM